MNLMPKILLSILATATLLFGGFIVLLIVALSGGLVFHQVIVAAVFIVVWLFLLMQIWKLFRPKIRKIFIATAVFVMIVSVAGFEYTKRIMTALSK